MTLLHRILFLACLFISVQTHAALHSYSEEHLDTKETSGCQSPLHHIDSELSVPEASVLKQPLLATATITPSLGHTPTNVTYRLPIRGSPVLLS